MKIDLQISPEYEGVEIKICASELNDELEQVMSLLKAFGDNKNQFLIVQNEDRKIVLKFNEIVLARIEEKRVNIYTQDRKYFCQRSLYELDNYLPENFIRISKQSLINMNKVQSVEAGFADGLYVNLSNGMTEYVTRNYLKNFKAYLGL